MLVVSGANVYSLRRPTDNLDQPRGGAEGRRGLLGREPCRTDVDSPRVNWLDTEGDDLASFAVVVPSWTLIVTFVVGLVVGAVAGRLMAVRGSSGAPDKVLEPRQPETKPEELAAGISGVSDASDKTDAPASGVDDLVSELERRYQGRRADGEADKPAQSRDL